MSYSTYSSTVPTRFRGIAEAPADWEARRLKFAVTYNDETLPDSTDPDSEITYVDIGSVDLIEGITATETLIFEEAPSRARRIVKDGDTIISTVRTYLKAIAAIEDPPENMIVSTGFTVIRPLEFVHRRYLGYALQGVGFVDRVVANSTGVSYPAINPTTLVTIPITYPAEFAEQKKIADFLDWKTGQIDALIAKKQQLIEKLQEQRIAVITQAVTKGLNPDAPMRKSGIPWLGQVPEHWEVPALKFRYSVELGKMLDEKRITGDHSIPYLRNVDVQWDQINYEDLPVMDITPYEYARYTIRDGDVLACEGGEVGRSAVVRGQGGVIGFQKAIHRLRANSEDELPTFVYYTLLWAVSTRVFSAEGSSTIAHLTADQLRRYRFPQPPLSEQKTIIAFLEDKVGQMKKLATKVESAIDYLTEYRIALITAATTGKIDVREAKIPTAPQA